MKSFIFIIAGIFLFLASLPFQGYAQQREANTEDSDALIKALTHLLNNDELSFGVLLQSQAEVHWDPNSTSKNTFRVPAARFKVYGNLDDHFSYVLQADITNNPALLDANIRYTTGRLAFTAGAQKPGISAEFLTSSGSTDFVNRSRVVNVLVNRRDIGLQASVRLSPVLSFSAGMFNGTNQKIENSNNTFYYTGRLVFNPAVREDNTVRIGLNGGRSIENGTRIGNGFLPAVDGDRIVYGGDIRLKRGDWLLSSELLMADLEYETGQDDDILGYYITGGYQASDKVQVLLRLDHLQSDLISINKDNMLLAGFNYQFTKTASFQFNYQINPDAAAFSSHYWLAQLQLAI